MKQMDDLISRKDAINIIQSWLDSDIGYSEGERNVMGCAIEELKNLPPAKCLANDRYAEGLREGAIIERKVTERWISVKDRLPEVGSEVLVCYDFKGKRSVYIANFYGDGEFHGLDDEYLTSEGRKYRKAVAWMPLPQPYKGESEE